MGDVSAEPSMEDILSSIKRIIAEEGDAAAPRPRRAARAIPEVKPEQQPETEESEDEILELNNAVGEPAAEETPAPPRSTESILSTQAAEASRGSLDALSRMIVKPGSPGTDTLEGLVREMLRPMLREWLDAQLPGMVEQMVAREISRITGQSS